MSESLRDTSEPGTWCFVFSKLNYTCLLGLCLQPVRKCCFIALSDEVLETHLSAWTIEASTVT